MNRTAILTATLLVALQASAALAVPFWYGDEEVTAAVTKYLQTAEPTVDNFLAMDEATLEVNREAKILSSVLGDLLPAQYQTLDEMAWTIGDLQATVDRYFAILYTKEIHDELWQQTREMKQAAYRKALVELRAAKDAHNQLVLKLKRLEDVRENLSAIGRRFKEVK